MLLVSAAEQCWCCLVFVLNWLRVKYLLNMFTAYILPRRQPQNHTWSYWKPSCGGLFY